MLHYGLFLVKIMNIGEITTTSVQDNSDSDHNDNESISTSDYLEMLL